MPEQKYGSLDDLNKDERLDGATKLVDHLNETLEIKQYDLFDIGKMPVAVIQCDKGKISTFSGPIIDSLKKMTDQLNRGQIFKVRAVKIKNYYKFEEVK